VLLAADVPVVAQRSRELLELDGDIEVASRASDGAEALRLFE
jgi:DNA-binding NarL/FixJ family response regulator